MTVDEIMTPQVLHVGMDETIGQVHNILLSKGFHHLLVLERGKLVGILSDRDVLNATSPFNHTRQETARDEGLLKRRVHQIMTRHPRTVLNHSFIDHAAEIMLTYNVSCLPVVDDVGDICGIVTWHDLLRHYMQIIKL